METEALWLQVLAARTKHSLIDSCKLHLKLSKFQVKSLSLLKFLMSDQGSLILIVHLCKRLEVHFHSIRVRLTTKHYLYILVIKPSDNFIIHCLCITYTFCRLDHRFVEKFPLLFYRSWSFVLLRQLLLPCRSTNLSLSSSYFVLTTLSTVFTHFCLPRGKWSPNFIASPANHQLVIQLNTPVSLNHSRNNRSPWKRWSIHCFIQTLS